MMSRGRVPVLLLGVWIGLIFGTSCAVVRPADFFQWLHTHVFISPELFERFQVFWGVSWFTIVKGWHATEFAILTWLCVKVLDWWMGRATRAAIGGAMLLCVAFAISDEWHQSFVPDRLGTVSDVLIDSLGVLIAGAVLMRRRSAAPVQTADENQADDAFGTAP